MSVRRKLFLAMSSFIVGMGFVFILLTVSVVWGIFYALLKVDRSPVAEELSRQFTAFYRDNGHSWNGVEQLQLTLEDKTGSQEEMKIRLISPEGDMLYSLGAGQSEVVVKLGVNHRIQSEGNWLATLYYYDREVGNTAKIKLGIRSSVTTLLILAAIVLVGIALAVANRLSKKMTAPLTVLLPAIDQLGQGKLGVQAPILSKDEYGKVAEAFNAMSLRIRQAEDARRKMTADVAHELRTPVTIIKGKLELLQQIRQPVDPHSLLPVQDELIRLSRLIDDLHLLSLAEARKLPLDLKPSSLPQLLRKIINHILIDAEQNDIAVTLTCKTDSFSAAIDANRMSQVFLNLLMNAIRYTPVGGKIDVTVYATEIEGREHVVTAITDNGLGIEQEHLPRLFDRFYRTDEARGREHGGMGLGLAIAKEFVLAHRGTIQVESEPGKGTTFTVTLPACQVRHLVELDD